MAATGQPDELTPARAAPPGALRRLGLVLTLVLGCLLVALSVIAIFVRVTVLNTDRYVDAMAPIAESPAVQRAVSDRLDAAITGKIDFDALMRDALPDRADQFAPALADSLRGAISSRLDAFVASDDFQQIWDEANRRVHSRVVDLLTTGESKRLELEGDSVYLDLSGAVDKIRSELEDRGLDRLAAAIPPDVDGRVLLLQSDAFVKARKGVHLLETLAIVLPILALLLLAGHVFLARPRRRGLLRVGIGLLVTAMLMLALVGLGRSAYLDAINQEQLPRDAAAAIFDALVALLRNGVRVVAIMAVVIAVIALLSGRTDRLHARRAVAWVGVHRAVLQGVVVVVGAIVLFAWDPPTVAVVLIDLGLVAAAVVLIGVAARVPPGGSGSALPASPGSSSSVP